MARGGSRIIVAGAGSALWPAGEAPERVNANSLYDLGKQGDRFQERLKAVAAAKSAHRKAHGCFDGLQSLQEMSFFPNRFVNGIRYDFRTRPLVVFTSRTRDLNIKCSAEDSRKENLMDYLPPVPRAYVAECSYRVIRSHGAGTVLSIALSLALPGFIAADVCAHSPGRGHAASRLQAQQITPTYTIVELAVLDPGQAISIRRLNSSDEVAGGANAPRKGGRAFLLTRNGREAVFEQQVTDFSTSSGINDVGEVVGAFNTNEALRPFRWTRRNGSQALPTLPGDAAGAAFGINNGGEAAGYSSGNGVRAVWWTRSGAIQALPPVSGANRTQGVAINDRGDVVGKSGSAGFSRAILWRNKGNPVDLGTLSGDAESEATSVNDAGDVVGVSSGSGRARAVLWPAGGAIQSLGVLPGGDDSRAREINGGRVVGISNSSFGSRAFIWTAAEGMRDLNTLVIGTGTNFVLTDAFSVNKNGVIVAGGQSAGDDNEIDGHEELPLSVVLLVPIR